MSETNRFTAGLQRITGKPVMTWRWAGVGLVVLAGLLLVGWIRISTSHQVTELQQQIRGIQLESVYEGGPLWNTIEDMNFALLRFQLLHNPADRQSFYINQQTVSNWFGKAASSLTNQDEQSCAREAQQAFIQYLTEVTPVLEISNSSASTPINIQDKFTPLHAACRKLLEAQHKATAEFLQASTRDLEALHSFLNISFAVLVALLFTTAALVYRVLIAPLQVKLSESEALLYRQEKLASLGILATGVAHEIRNPLTAIKFRLFSLKKSLPTLAENEDLDVIHSEINRLERIVKDFLQFARPSEPETVDFPVHRMYEEIHALLQPQLARQHVKLKQQCPEDLWLRADKQQIEQVLINLVQNAAEAIGQNGTIMLRASAGSVTLPQQSGPVVQLEVMDTGSGIPPEVERRIFDPFFSTKEGGTGLGLPIASRIVEKHGGILNYQSQLNRGTTFTILLPRTTSHESQTTPG